jgi:hypothetical protein
MPTLQKLSLLITQKEPDEKEVLEILELAKELNRKRERCVSL